MDEMTSILLSPDEVRVVQEALENWITSAERDSMFAGLMLSALMSKDVPGESINGKETRERMEEHGKEEASKRKRLAYGILAKL